MIELVNLIDSLSPEILMKAIKGAGLGKTVRNIKPLLRFVADKTNGSRVHEGAWWSLKAMSRITGETERKLYRMRTAAEALNLLIVNKNIAETVGERDQPSQLIITNQVLRCVDEELYHRVTKEEWGIDVVARWVTLCQPPSDTLSAMFDAVSDDGCQYVTDVLPLCQTLHVTMSAKTEINGNVIETGNGTKLIDEDE